LSISEHQFYFIPRPVVGPLSMHNVGASALTF
jgi:hypothetical protein